MIRAVFFDAVDTLIVPHPSAVEVYQIVARSLGSQLERGEVGRRFRSAWCREDEIDRDNAWKTDEERERLRWRTIVASVLDDVRDGAACFHELWAHFSRSAAWRCLDGAAETLAELARQGLILGMASNFDSRLRSVLAGLPGLGSLRHLVISSEIGWRKPAPEFFQRVIGMAGVGQSEILFVGDDPINDDEGARRAGLQVLRLDPRGGPGTLLSLRDLPRRIVSLDEVNS